MLGDSALRDFDFTVLHTHNYWEVLVIADGECTHYYNGKQYPLTKNEFVLIKPSDVHRFVKKEGAKFSHLNFIMRDEAVKAYCDYLSPSLYDELLNSELLSGIFGISQIEQIVKYNDNISISLNKPEQNHFYVKAFVSFVIEFLVRTYRINDNTSMEWLNKLLVTLYSPAYLDKFPRDVTASLGFSHQYVLRVFKKATGKKLIDYMNEIKLNQAGDFLLYHDLSTLEIANKLGFYSLSHFNHLFKKYYGVSPRQYVKQMKEKSTDMNSEK